MSLKLKFAILLLVFVITLGSILVILYTSSQDVSRQIKGYETSALPQREYSEALLDRFERIDYLFEIALLTGESVLFDNAGEQKTLFFEDLDRLTIFADNLVPHVLRVERLLWYEKHLLAQINEGVLVAAGSPQEIEIRACALHAVECLVAELQRLGRKVTAMQLDNYLWNRGQERFFKSKPRHRTRTAFY